MPVHGRLALTLSEVASTNRVEDQPAGSFWRRTHAR